MPVNLAATRIVQLQLLSPKQVTAITLFIASCSVSSPARKLLVAFCYTRRKVMQSLQVMHLLMHVRLWRHTAKRAIVVRRSALEFW